jgi:nucleotide-binding universal stress UspA family protein
MNHQKEPRQARSIVAGIDASPQSLAALQAAADIAELLDVDLHGLFIEDINLVHMCGLPFTCEVGSFTAAMRRLDNEAMERQLRAMAGKIRHVMEQIGQRQKVHCTFEVRRGPVVNELLAAAEGAALLSVGRTAGRRRTTLGSTAQSIIRSAQRPLMVQGEEGGLRYPFVVLYTGDEQADRTLRLALALAESKQGEVVVLLWGGSHNEVAPERLEEQAVQIIGERKAAVKVNVIEEIAELLHQAHRGRGCTLFLPGKRAYLLAQHAGPTILVP